MNRKITVCDLCKHKKVLSSVINGFPCKYCLDEKYSHENGVLTPAPYFELDNGFNYSQEEKTIEALDNKQEIKEEVNKINYDLERLKDSFSKYDNIISALKEGIDFNALIVDDKNGFRIRVRAYNLDKLINELDNINEKEK